MYLRTGDAHTDRGDNFVFDLLEEKACKKEFGFLPETFRRIIARTTYATKSMTKLITYKPPIEEWSYRKEILFQTRGGKFLLAGEGKTISPWSKKLPDCNDHLAAHAYLPLTLDEVREWLEIRGLETEGSELLLTSDEKNAAASEVLIRLSPAIARLVADDVKRQGISLQAWCARAIESALRARSKIE